MEHDFITVAQAVKITNKHQTTITRFCQKWLHTPFVKMDGNAYQIDRDWLIDNYGLRDRYPFKTDNAPERLKAPETIPVEVEEPEQENTQTDNLPSFAPELEKECERSTRKLKETISTLELMHSLMIRFLDEQRELERQAANAERKNFMQQIERMEDDKHHMKHQLEKKDSHIDELLEGKRELHDILANAQNQLHDAMQQLATAQAVEEKQTAWGKLRTWLRA